MNKVVYTVLISLMLAFSVAAFAQTPPPPNNGNGATFAPIPVGGGAPIAGGVGTLRPGAAWF
ncbi:MAG: hypothetical protein IPJ40_16925 [Saprospirales bacterium]|nr:hypothetical protein [Saprospirales bacterium]